MAAHGHLVTRFAFFDRPKKTLEPLCLETFGVPISELNKDQKEIFRPLMVAYAAALHQSLGEGILARWVAEQIIAHRVSQADIGSKQRPLEIITDLRTVPQARFIHSWGGIVVNIDSPSGYANATERKESPMVRAAADYQIFNDLETDRAEQDLLRIIQENLARK